MGASSASSATRNQELTQNQRGLVLCPDTCLRLAQGERVTGQFRFGHRQYFGVDGRDLVIRGAHGARLSFLLWGEPGRGRRRGGLFSGGCEVAPDTGRGWFGEGGALCADPGSQNRESSPGGAVLVQREYFGVEGRHLVVQAGHGVGSSFLLWGEPGRGATVLPGKLCILRRRGEPGWLQPFLFCKL